MARHGWWAVVVWLAIGLGACGRSSPPGDSGASVESGASSAGGGGVAGGASALVWSDPQAEAAPLEGVQTRTAAASVVPSAAAPTRERAASPGEGDYVRGLQAVSAGRFADALGPLGRAVEASDEDADRHLALSIAAMLARSPAIASGHLERVRRLEPRHPSLAVWSFFFAWAYEPPGSGGRRNIPTPPHGSKESYAKELIHAAEQYAIGRQSGRPEQMDAAWKQADQCARTWAFGRLSRPGLASAQGEELEGMYRAGRYAECLAIATRLLESAPRDARVLAISGDCRLAMNDWAGAREDYTRSLAAGPGVVAVLAGRAVAAARSGGLRTAEDDRDLLKKLGGAPPDGMRELDAAIGEAKKKLGRGTPSDFLAQAREAAARSDTGGLESLAEQLQRGDAAVRPVMAEVYARELCRLQSAFERDPQRVRGAVELAAFCIRPTAEIDSATGRGRVRVRVGEADLDRARVALDAAGRLSPNDPDALTQQALWMRARGGRAGAQRMIQAVEYALSLGALNHDLAVMYLDYYQDLAASLEGEAAALRSPTVTYEDRADGRWRVTYPPTAQALARAAELERLAKEHRRRSFDPIRSFIQRQRGSPLGLLAQAEVHRMLGEYGPMIASAEAALEADAHHLEALEYLVEHGPKVGMNDKALGYADTLNNLAEPSARIALGPVDRLLSETRYASALGFIDEAQRKDPASWQAAVWRAVVTGASGKADAARTDFRLAAAIAGAMTRVRQPSPAAPVSADLAVPVLVAQTARWKAEMARDGREALDAIQRLLSLADRVPATQLDTERPQTRFATVFRHDQDKRRTGNTVREMMVEALLDGTRLLGSMDRNEEAARMLVRARELSEKMAWRPPIDALAYPLIQKLGEERAATIFPPIMMEGYRVMGRFGSVRENFRGSQTSGIDAQADRAAWIQARLGEIENDLRVLERSQTLTAARKREELTQERERLRAEWMSMQNSPPRRRGP